MHQSSLVNAVIVIILSLSLGTNVYYFSQYNEAKQITTTLTQVSTSDVTMVVPETIVQLKTQTTVETTTQQSILFVPCSTIYKNGSYPYDFSMKENSTLLLCVRFYYYNLTATTTFNSSDRLSISGMRNGSEISNNAISNFTISAEPNTFTIGGPSNENEGALVVYKIHSAVNSNGTYVMNMGLLYPNLEMCASEFNLVVGNGKPDYSFVSGCIVLVTTNYYLSSNSSTTVTESTALTPIPQGFIAAEIVGAGNSSSS